MKKRKVAVICAGLLMFLGMVIFFGVIKHIQKKQQLDLENKVNKESDIEEYKTGEILSVQDAYGEAGCSEITYVAFRLFEEVETENESDYSIYFVENPELVKQILQGVENEKFEVNNTSYDKMKDCQEKWELWLGYEEDKSIVISASTTQWDNVSLCRFVLLEPGGSRVLDDGFMDTYFQNGLFMNDKLVDILLNIVRNDIHKLSLEEVELLTQDSRQPVLRDFQQYRYTTGYDSQMNAPVFTFPLEDEKGVIEVRYNIALDKELYKIFSVIHKDKTGKVQEVLYETGDNEV